MAFKKRLLVNTGNLLDYSPFFLFVCITVVLNSFTIYKTIKLILNLIFFCK